MTVTSTTGLVSWNSADTTDLDYTPAPFITRVNDEDDVLECTYTNQQRVSTITTTQSVFPNDSATVTGTLGSGSGR